MKNKINLGFVGVGARNTVYARNLKKQFAGKINISAACDIDKNRLNDFKTQYGQRDTVLYKDFRKLLKDQNELDGYLIAPPNYLHEEIAVPFLLQGKHILLEKPIAHTHESCMNIARAYNKSSSRVTIGFVLRYTPFYRTIVKMCKEGKIGKIMVLNADEVVGPVLSSVFFRTWRGKVEYTGNLLLEKCCHDLDLINEILGVNPVRVTAFASDNHYGPKEGYGSQCNVCSHKNTCAYSTILWKKNIDRGEDNGEYEYVDFSNDACVYNNEHNIIDRQSQLIEYEGNILIYFNVSLGGTETRRTVDIIGTEGRIMGNFRQSQILYYKMDSEVPEKINIEHEKSGHGGGDSVITRSFIESLENPNYIPEASIKDALKSALLAFLCDKARDEEKVLSVNYLKEVNLIRD